MNFRIADTFTASLARLTCEEQKLVKQTAFDAQMNPAHPGLRFHKLNRIRDKRFWSLSAGMDLRIIVHRTNADLLFCYTAHHDDAYAWAENRKLEVHPKTGAAQLVEIREVVQTLPQPRATGTFSAPALFAAYPDDLLLGYGVPPEWLPAVRALADQDALLDLATHLPAEAGEALLDLALGHTPQKPTTTGIAPTGTGDISPDAFLHPDAQRRFRLMGSAEELQRALEYPWEKWLVFLHPDQRRYAEGVFNGPVKICGSAGTGKTVVALHRAAHLARTHPEARILLTTLSDPLARTLKNKLHCLLAHEPKLAERIDVRSLAEQARRLFRLRARKTGAEPVSTARVRDILREETAALGLTGYTERFLCAEWEELVDARQLRSWEAYRTTPRLGRKTRLSEQRRQVLWGLFERVNGRLTEEGLHTEAALYTHLADLLPESGLPPFDFIIVDEAQDLSYAQLRFVAALGAHRPDALCFCGDLGQRIFQLPFSWKSLGVDIRGRSHTLRVNYRTSHQIRSQADKLLDAELHDADGNTEKRGDPISAFNGPPPQLHTFASQNEECADVAEWLAARRAEGASAREMAVFVRSEAEIPRAEAALKKAGIPFAILADDMDIPDNSATVAVMHLAKGLEFSAVAVIACDAETIPSQQRIEEMGDAADLEEVYNTERQLLYVACTRARDHLLVCGVEPASEFLDDLLM